MKLDNLGNSSQLKTAYPQHRKNCNLLEQWYMVPKAQTLTKTDESSGSSVEYWCFGSIQP